MKNIILFTVFFISQFAISNLTYAQTSKGASRIKKTSSGLQPSRALGFNLLFWQEEINGQSSTASEDFVLQFEGFGVDYYYFKPFQRSRWQSLYTAQISSGYAKGQGTSLQIQDKLKKQPWIALTGGIGLTYRTSPVSDIGFMIPATFRTINWFVESGSDLKMDEESSVSTGLSLIYNNRFSKSTRMQLSLTHHIMWETTIWAAGVQRTY